MGLTHDSTGARAAEAGLVIRKSDPSDRVIALAGNPNVGKSTVFNALTGLNQHTGNWPGKTVSSAQGRCEYEGQGYVFVDLPGCYSLMAHSAEEEVARDFISFGGADAVVVVCDATCLERNLNLVLQTAEITPRVVVCVNLLDEARKKHIHIDMAALSARLGVPVIGAEARAGKGLDTLMEAVSGAARRADTYAPVTTPYPEYIEKVLEGLTAHTARVAQGRIGARWLALRLLEGDAALRESVSRYLNVNLSDDAALCAALDLAQQRLSELGVSEQRMKDDIVSALVQSAERACAGVVTFGEARWDKKDRMIDRVLSGRWTGFPIMLLGLLVIFWITLSGANYPSALLSAGLFWLEDRLMAFCVWAGCPELLSEMLVLGVYRVLAWVVSVMLPPMAIFFPLFTLLEDSGYLPRVAFNLDKCFKTCGACGKQSLTMCMGFGCNAVGVMGCRIIDSPRERLIAILTNSFVPCNGRFPTMISILSMFFIGVTAGLGPSLLSAAALAAIIVLGVGMTFAVSKLLSLTLLKGAPSSFTLELPPYRRPQFGKVIVRSICDRTLFVLGRAASIAAPAGLLIWVMANATVGGNTLLNLCAGALDPLARLMGLDGVILLAFILGLPANEIVIPIIIMAYTAQGSLLELSSLDALRQLLVDNGWTWLTAVSALLFSLMHWPCSTTLMTIKKETGGLKWTVAAFILPTAAGMAACMLFAGIARLLV